MKNNKNHFDVVISGGGLAGCLLALSLADLTKADGRLLSIAIVEATQDSTVTSTPRFDDRVLALSHGSADYLKKMGVWQYLANDACAIKKIDISDRGHYGKARIDAQSHGVSALGYVIEMALIGKAQLKVLASKPNVQWLCPDRIIDINWQAEQEDRVEIKLDTGQYVQANLLLACDGANSPCRQLAGITVRHRNYQQVALIANVATENPHNNKAFERFTEFGPLAMLPLTRVKSQLKDELSHHQNSDNRCSLVWTMTPEQSERVLALSDDEFKQQLERAFGSWLGVITLVGKRAAYPLVLSQATQQTYHRMALIGNAAHTIHPIAGQGFNLGLRDVQVMASLLRESLQAERDIGSFSLLNSYAQQRQLDQQQVIELTDSLVTLFSSDLPPLIAGRNIGLKVMNYVSALKTPLVNKLMGY
ncbi:2-octaprenyl-6-methoxyphenyl hydroxylase [Colwellia sp. KU-HH00111]|uniref:2-octaprenyl-6-methoxyphenyl hydroxylase n=1 Tax=Colwellia sp. KU-HH00111 TaxID=3127652 RepID=UPI0031068841